MITRKHILAGFIAAICAFGFVGCAKNTETNGNPVSDKTKYEQLVAQYRPLITPVVKAAASFAIKNVKAEDKEEVVNYMFSVSAGVRTLINGDLADTDKIQGVINLWTEQAIDIAEWRDFAVVIQGLYNIEKAKIEEQLNGDARATFTLIEAIAAGVEQAALEELNK